MMGISSPGNLYLVEKFADLEFDKVDKLGIVDEVDLIKEDD